VARWNIILVSLLICSAALGGCSGAPTLVSVPRAPQLDSPSEVLPAQGIGDSASAFRAAQSWTAPDAAARDLLYVLDNSHVTIYSYPQGKLEGKLRHFYLADDACVDKNSNVYIVNLGYGRVFEYAHGGSKRLRDLNIPGAAGCSIDPTSGNLAVSGGNSQGGLHIFKRARGTPKTYKDPSFYRYYFCGYDNKGDLFIDGQSAPGASGDFVLAELPSGGGTLKNIAVNQYIGWPGAVQWDGKHVTIQDASGKAPVMYQFAINGSEATKVGTTHFDGASGVHQAWIQGGTVIVPNVCETSCDYSDVLFYRYPAGGPYTKKLRKGVWSDLGVVISLAPKADR
jgi:hypothetical protein